MRLIIKNHKVGFGVGALILVLVIVLSVVGSFRSSSKSDFKEIEFWTLQLSDFAPYINNVIHNYEYIHPDVRIKWVDVPFSEGEKRSLAAVMSNRVPDLINMNPNFGATLASRGALVNIKQFITKTDYDKYLKESWDASSLDDMIFGIPWYITSSITIYNSKMLKDAGLDPDKPPKTFEELGDMSKIIKNKTDKYAFMPNLTEDGKLIQIFNKYDIPIVNKQKTRALFNTDKAAEIMNFWANLYNNDLIPPESLTEGHRASLERYEAGDTAFILAGANFLKTIKDDAPVVYALTKVAPQVEGSNNKVDFALMNLVVPIKSQYKKEAVDFALYLTNTQNQLEFCKLAPILPSTVATINSDFFKEKPNADIMGKARAISASQLNHALKPIPTLANQKDLFEIIDFSTQDVILNHKNPKDTINNAVKKWNQLLKDK